MMIQHSKCTTVSLTVRCLGEYIGRNAIPIEVGSTSFVDKSLFIYLVTFVLQRHLFGLKC